MKKPPLPDYEAAKRIRRYQKEQLFALAVTRPCTMCGAKPGELCVGALGPRLGVHVDRKKQYYDRREKFNACRGN